MAYAAPRKTNWFAIGVTIAVVIVVVVVGAAVWWANSLAADPGEAPQSAAVDSETGAIAVGEGENSVDTYIDFMCPVCGQFEDLYGPTLEEYVNDGTITLNIHPISILDRASLGTEYSTRSAAAMYCVAEDDATNALPFLQTMFANQPSESTEGLDNATIIELAESVGASDAVASCIEDGTYEQYVTVMTQETPIQQGNSGIATPTIVVNGETLVNSVALTGDPEADLLPLFN